MSIHKAPSSWIVNHLRQGRLPVCAVLLVLLPLLLLAPAALAQYAESAEPAAATPPAMSTPSIASPYGTFSPQDEQEIVQLLNRERQALGLSTLVVDERLQQAARKHSTRMAATGEIEHEFAGEPVLSRRIGETALRFDSCGENVARAATATLAHTALMNSPHHRANILDGDYNAIGIGVVRTPQGLFITQDFARRFTDTSVGEAEEQISLNLNRLRHRAGAPLLNRVAAPRLRQMACEMAANDHLNPRAGLTSGVGNSIAFTATDLTEIPDSLDRLKARPARGFSVGACFQSSPSFDGPVFWVLLVTYY